MNPVLIFLLIAVLILTVGLVNAFINFIFFKRLEDYVPGEDQPFVSILVPARNEERNIEACVKSLLSQQYDNFEVIVLNDHSSDSTGAILQRMAAADSRLQVINGTALPTGWPGKHWACQQLGKAAKGEYILFTDADTRHQPHALACAIAAAQKENADLVSAIPREEVFTWAEKLIVPFMNAGMVSFLPLRLVQKKQIAPLSVTIGQFMLFRRSVYEEIGGYEAACQNVNDDVLMGRTIIQKGFHWMLLDGSDAVSCRMYQSLSEIIDGFSKNVFGFFDYLILPYLLLWTSAALIFLEPARIAAHSLLNGQMETIIAKLALVAVVESFFIFLLAYRRMAIPQYLSFFYYLTVFLFVIIAMRSMVLTLTGRASWKGRTLEHINVRWI